MCWLNGQGGYVLQGLIVQGLVNQRIFVADKGWGRGKGYHLYTRKQKFDCYQQGKGVGCTKTKTRLLKAMFLLTYQIPALEGGLQKHPYKREHLLSEQIKKISQNMLGHIAELFGLKNNLTLLKAPNPSSSARNYRWQKSETSPQHQGVFWTAGKGQFVGKSIPITWSHW